MEPVNQDPCQNHTGIDDYIVGGTDHDGPDMYFPAFVSLQKIKRYRVGDQGQNGNKDHGPEIGHSLQSGETSDHLDNTPQCQQ